MKQSKLEAMPLDDLWKLHETIIAILESKLTAQKCELEKRLEELGRLGESANTVPKRRTYPKVQAKFQNPERPLETWSGRGKQPRWMGELLKAGKTIDDFLISTVTS
jgi:DNA-binding protein H-NS